jgi:hypothetical protein
MKGCNGREKQCSGKTGISEPFRSATKDAGCYKHIVPVIAEGREEGY